MRHIKIYEDYSDDELKDLLGDMRSVGQSRVNLDIDYGPYHVMGEKEKEGERNIAENWSSEIPGGEYHRLCWNDGTAGNNKEINKLRAEEYPDIL